MKILFVGDIVGACGRGIFFDSLPSLKREHALDMVIVNGENAAHGKGITLNISEELFEAGVDVITMGNHVWNNKDIFQIISYVCFALAGSMLFLAVILFFRFRVRYLIEKLSGKNEVRQVREIRSNIGKASKKVAYEIFQSGKKSEKELETEPGTELLNDENTVILQPPAKNNEPEIVLLQDDMEIHTKERI